MCALSRAPLRPTDFRPLQAILEKDNGGAVEVSTPYGIHLWYHSDDPDGTDLYLKTFPDQLIISRIQLRTTRKGTGSQILEWLKAYAKSTGLRAIVVECVNTLEMVNFCKKHGFVPDPAKTIKIDGILYGNYNLCLAPSDEAGNELTDNSSLRSWNPPVGNGA